MGSSGWVRLSNAYLGLSRAPNTQKSPASNIKIGNAGLCQGKICNPCQKIIMCANIHNCQTYKHLPFIKQHKLVNAQPIQLGCEQLNIRGPECWGGLSVPPHSKVARFHSKQSENRHNQQVWEHFTVVVTGSWCNSVVGWWCHFKLQCILKSILRQQQSVHKGRCTMSFLGCPS